MTENTPKLVLVCGKPAAGKSTLARQLGEAKRTVVISEDEWLAALYRNEMSTTSDYVQCSRQLRGIMGRHVVSLLKAGISVVLDYPASTLAARSWMNSVAKSAIAASELHYLDLPNDLCKTRLRGRNEAGEHQFQLTEEQFDQIASHFVAPTADEGFELVVHRLK